VVLSNTDPNEEKVKRQVAKVRETLSQVKAEQSDRKGLLPVVSEKGATSLSSPDVDRLERMLRVIKDEGTGTNPEMQELNKVLDKLITVQHPDVAIDTAGKKPDAVTLRPLAVFPAHAEETVSGWKAATGKTNRFYDLETNNGDEKPDATDIEAIIPETQTLMNGALLKLELATELVVKNINIPRGTPLYGVAHLNGERLQVTIVSIRYLGQLYPVSLQVVDQDGLTGIYEPGSISRDVARESAGESINGIGATSLDPSLGAQVATAGIQMARSLAGKKIRLVRVTVKKGYRVFLKDTSF
jgi:conjugative transposon TraM protein